MRRCGHFRGRRDDRDWCLCSVLAYSVSFMEIPGRMQLQMRVNSSIQFVARKGHSHVGPLHFGCNSSTGPGQPNAKGPG